MQLKQEQFDTSKLDNVFSHLTNTSINKLSPSLFDEKEDVGQGCKWTFAKLRDHFAQQNWDFDKVWKSYDLIDLA
jgi:tubulin polyglutamylase TTLL2